MTPDKTEKTLHIALVEDSEHDLLAFRRSLDRSGLPYKLFHFPRAEYALESLKNDGASFHILVTDYKLPGITGLEMFKHLKQLGVPFPVVMITGSGTEELAVEALKAGIDDYLIKDPQSRYLELLPMVLTNAMENFDNRSARKEAENALKESEAKLRAMMESVDGYVYACTRDFRIEFMNERLIERTGYDGTGLLCYEVLHERDSVCPWCVNERIFSGEHVKWEIQSPKDNKWYYVINSPLHHANGTVSKQSLIFDITERKEMEEALKNSEKKLFDILNLLPDPTFAIDMEGKVILWNLAAEEFTGVKAENMLGRDDHEYSVPLYGEKRPILIDLVLSPSKTDENSYQQFRKNNSVIYGENFTLSSCHGEAYMSGVAAPLYDSEGKLIGAIESIRNITEHKILERDLRKAQEDLEHRVAERTEELALTVSMLQEAVTMLQDEITVRKKSEQDLLNSQERLRLAQQAGHIGTFEWDITSDSMIWDQGMESLYGLTNIKQETQRKNWNKYVHPEDLSALKMAIRKAIRKRTDIQHEFRIIWPDKSIHWIEIWAKVICDDNGNAIRMVGINIDITERKKTEESLRKYSEELYDLYNQSPCGYHSLNSDGYFVLINDTELKWLGYTREEIIKKMKFSDLLTENGKRVFEGTFPQLKKDGYVLDLEQEMLKKDGTVLPVILSATAIYDSNGNYVMSRSTLFDITDLKQTEEKLRQKDMLMMQQSRLAAMGEMIGNIAHQWRQPLNTLGLLIQQLPYVYGTDECTREYIEECCSESMTLIDHMSQTIDDFRNFFRPDKEKVNFDINRVIKRTVSLIDASFINQQISLTTHCEGTYYVSGYPNEYSQVILTILNNARDAFTAKGNRIVEVKSFLDEEKTIVTITDNAGGIPEDILNRIFDPYFTTKGSHKGTGIGLYIAKTIIEQNMGGRLTASNINGGAEFRIEI